MRGHKVIEWEHQLKLVLDEVDDLLEERYGKLWPLHPTRPTHGHTANRAYDGLFTILAAFSAGYGSQLGRGYIINVRLSTLSMVPRNMRRKLEDEAAEMIRERLPRAFPGRELQVSRDDRTYKIVGDLSLGSL